MFRRHTTREPALVDSDDEQGYLAGQYKKTNADKMQTQKSSNESLFIVTRTHSMHIFGEIPFIKPQNDT